VSDGNQEREYQVGVFEARKRIIKLLTEQEYQAGVRAERERIVQCLDMALFWALGNPQEPKDEIWSAEQTIKFAKKLITGELSVVRLKDSNE
jgi:hypothetical protein